MGRMLMTGWRGIMFSRQIAVIAMIGVAIFSIAHAGAQGSSIVVSSTTSTHDSGLFDHLLPRFTKKTGITVTVLAQGTGQALDSARRGEADVVFVHARFAELRSSPRDTA
jgi:tungstate transport system substrate-binding protein